MDSDRVEGKTKQLEGEAQGLGSDKARDVADDVEDAVDRDDAEDEDEKHAG